MSKVDDELKNQMINQIDTLYKFVKDLWRSDRKSYFTINSSKNNVWERLQKQNSVTIYLILLHTPVSCNSARVELYELINIAKEIIKLCGKYEKEINPIIDKCESLLILIKMSE